MSLDSQRAGHWWCSSRRTARLWPGPQDSWRLSKHCSSSKPSELGPRMEGLCFLEYDLGAARVYPTRRCTQASRTSMDTGSIVLANDCAAYYEYCAYCSCCTACIDLASICATHFYSSNAHSIWISATDHDSYWRNTTSCTNSSCYARLQWKRKHNRTSCLHWRCCCSINAQCRIKELPDGRCYDHGYACALR